MSISGSSTGEGGANSVHEPAPSAALAGTVSPGQGHELPLVDLAVLLDLEEQLDNPAVAREFARDYAAMWGHRYRSLAAAVDSQERAAALDAVISLKVASAMVGGLRLARLAEELEVVIRRGDLYNGEALLATVADHGSETVKALQLTYILADE